MKNLNNTSINRKDIELKTDIINSHIIQIDEIKSNLDTINNELSDLKKNNYLIDFRYCIDDVYIFNINIEKDVNFIADIKKILIYNTEINNNFLKIRF